MHTHMYVRIHVLKLNVHFSYCRSQLYATEAGGFDAISDVTRHVPFFLFLRFLGSYLVFNPLLNLGVDVSPIHVIPPDANTNIAFM